MIDAMDHPWPATAPLRPVVTRVLDAREFVQQRFAPDFV
jgi:hypothetical protein